MAYISTQSDIAAPSIPSFASAHVVLQIASIPAGHDLMEKCIRVHGQKGRPKTEALHPDLDCIPHGITRDPATWSISDFGRVPSDYLWALLRSYRGSKNRDDQADKLKSLLALMDGESQESKDRCTHDTQVLSIDVL